MAIKLNGEIYYRSAETAEMVGISRSTLFRWIRKGVVGDSSHRDRRSWRLFTESDIQRIKGEVNNVR